MLSGIDRRERIEALRQWHLEMDREWSEERAAGTLPAHIQDEYDINGAELRTLVDAETRALDAIRTAANGGSRESGWHGGTDPIRPTGASTRRSEWVRTLDMNPAIVERGQSFANHEVVRAERDRFAAREAAMIGQHGDLGHLLRSMSTTSGSAIVPTIWASDIIDRARNYAAVLKAGANIVPMDAKVVQIGRLTTDPTAAFRTEGSTITASDPVFDNVTLTATTMNTLVIGSIEWFQDAPNVNEIVTNAIAKAVALQLDLVALYGGVTTGGEGINLANPPNPRGVLATLLAVASSSVLGGGANGTTQTATSVWNEVIDTIYTPQDFNEQPNALLWPSRLARKYAEFYDTQNNPIRVPDVVTNMEKFVTNQVASGFAQGTGTTMADLFVADWTQLLIGQRLGFTVQTLTERYAELGQLGIIATWRGDVQLARPRAFAAYRYLKGV